MILSVVPVLLPIVLLLALGAVLRRVGFLDGDFASRLLRLVFYTALPCKLVESISRAESLGGVGAAALALCGVTAASCVIAAAAARVCGIRRSSIPSFCQTAVRGNAAYVGIPVLALATGGTALESDTMRVAALTLAFYSVFCNVGAVLLLAGGNMPDGGGRATGASLPTLLREMATNPLIVGSLAGLALLAIRKTSGVGLPAPIQKTMALLGAMATPGALLSLGASLTPDRLRAALRPAALAVAVKLALCPLLGVAASVALALPPAHRLVVLVFLACPCSTASYIMDKAMGGDAELSGAAVVLSTALCALPAALAVAAAGCA